MSPPASPQDDVSGEIDQSKSSPSLLHLLRQPICKNDHRHTKRGMINSTGAFFNNNNVAKGLFNFYETSFVNELCIRYICMFGFF